MQMQAAAELLGSPSEPQAKAVLSALRKVILKWSPSLSARALPFVFLTATLLMLFVKSLLSLRMLLPF
jgi:hypothetical protein